MTLALALIALWFLWHIVALTAAALESGPIAALSLWAALIFCAYHCIC